MTSNEDDDKIYKDTRFAHLVNDPRFKRLPQSQRKVKVDKRFQGMFNDDKFKVTYKVDKYGRKVNKSSGEDLKKFYEISSGDEDDDEGAAEEEEEEKRKEEIAITKDESEADESSEDSDEDEDGNAKLKASGDIKAIIKKKLQDLSIDYARGEGKILTDSSSDDDSSEGEGEDGEELFIEHVWGELDKDAPMTEESTRRLAVCNMDWDRMRAVDIMVLCNSFLPPSGTILTVTVYPSEYGKERLAEEEVKGPMELIENSKTASENTAQNDKDIDSEDDEAKEEGDEGDDYHMEKLRQYQLNRLKYYYAVIECDSVATGDKLYAECDGLEYESTATKLDLRFIPDDMEFDDEPRDRCTELPDMDKYKPRIFTTTALQQVKVDLTWDETEIERKELTEKLATGKINDVSDADLRKYVAYSSEDEDDDGEDEKPTIRKLTKKAAANESDVEDDESASDSDAPEEQSPKKNKKSSISKYKDLLAEINKKEEDVKKNKIEMEYTWGIGMKGKLEKPEKNKSFKPESSEVNPFDKLIEKKKAKKKEKRAALRKAKKNKGSDDDEEVSEDDTPDGLDMNDPYFAEEFKNGEFEKPKKKTSKTKKVTNDDSDDEEERKTAELELLLDDGEEEKAHFSLKKIQDAENETKSKKKRRKQLKKSKQEIEASKKQVEDDFEVDVKDSRFSAVFDSHLFNIDPSDPHFKKTKGMETLIKEKLKRKHGNSTDGSGQPMEAKKLKSNLETRMLVNSIKRKIAGSNLN